MKRFSEQLNKKAQSVKLRAAEKRELRERVVSYMEYHPLPAEMKTVQKTANKKSILTTEEYKEVPVPWKLLGRWALGTFALILIAVPFAAERSVPGDNLYAVKRFNEEVRGTLALNPIQKVEWETERLNRRIAEARLLASEGRLTNEVEAEVAEAVRTHSANAQKNIEVLRGEDADEATLAAITLETTLSVQSAALQDDKTNTADGIDRTSQPSLLATAVEESRVQTNATNASSTIPAFDKVMAKVEQNTTRVYELLDSLRDTASEEEIAEITRRIEDIERSVESAIAQRDSDDDEARAILVDSLQRTQKLVVFMTDIEVSETVDIESIVPVVLTDDEEQTMVTAYQEELDNKVEAIETALPTLEEASVIEKVTLILSEIDTNLARISTSSDFALVRDSLENSLDLARDIYAFLELDVDQATDEEENVSVDLEIASSTDEVASSTEVAVEDDTGSTTDESRLEETIIPDGEASASSTATSTVTVEGDVDTE